MSSPSQVYLEGISPPLEVAVTIMHKHDVGISFARFVVSALPYAALHIALAIVYVLVFLG